MVRWKAIFILLFKWQKPRVESPDWQRAMIDQLQMRPQEDGGGGDHYTTFADERMDSQRVHDDHTIGSINGWILWIPLVNNDVKIDEPL